MFKNNIEDFQFYIQLYKHNDVYKKLFLTMPMIKIIGTSKSVSGKRNWCFLNI
jgi:hypothetical protein